MIIRLKAVLNDEDDKVIRLKYSIIIIRKAEIYVNRILGQRSL